MDGWMDGQMDGRKDGGTHRQTDSLYVRLPRHFCNTHLFPGLQKNLLYPNGLEDSLQPPLL